MFSLLLFCLSSPLSPCVFLLLSGEVQALERQKEFFEPVRSERDTLREEVTRLRDELKKHGIALDSVGTPNGDASIEPPVNSDGRPDPPVRATSMGSSKEAVEKKETMSVVGEIPPSKTEQHEQKIPLTAPPETQLNAEGGDKAIEQNIQISSNSNDEANTGGTQCGFRSNLENPEEDLKLNLKSTSIEYEMAVDECTPENLNKVDLDQNFSEVHRETSVDQRDTSPVESEVFQDALEEIVQSPLVGSQLSEEHIVAVEDFRNEDYDTSQQDFKKEEDKCEVQSTSVESSSDPNNKASELSEGGDNAGVTTDDMINLHTDTKDDNETSNPDDSSQDDSEESTSDEITSTVADPEKETRPEELSVPIESVLQWKEDDSGKTDSDPNCTSEEKSVSADTSIHPSDHDVEEEENIHVTQKQSSQGIELTKEEHQLVDSENNTFGEVSEPCTVINEQSTVESESLRNSKDSEPSISLVKQCEDATDSESLNTNLESLKNLKVDSSGNELLDKREQDTHSDNLMYDTSKKTNNELNTVLSDASGIEELNEEKPDISDHPVCDRSVNLHEETNTVFPDAQNKEVLDEGNPGKILDHPVCDKSESKDDNVPVVVEEQKETVLSETFSSEGESTPEGEESDDNEDDVALRSEKYTGESLPLGSSVDQTSTDDIRMEEGPDKASRKGKGKNKEDCVVS
uniref:Uncharacterized protein n=1 Tax=Pyxicephalus adspersus TaxID=30357 RepID=A0AAV3A289_PYXAD|nr:TPA: hypothetical protein GDO54_015707 [Pyxicephalus adspersus]